MFNKFKQIFQKKPIRVSKFTNEQYDEHFEKKSSAIEKILGKSHNYVGHAIIPYEIGGAVDMYYYPNTINGTAFVTQELINPDGTGPQPNNFGTYELLAFTKEPVSDCNNTEGKFYRIERELCGIFTKISRYSKIAILNPGETLEIPSEDNQKEQCIILDEWNERDTRFQIGETSHGLLLIIRVHRSEMEYAMKNGSRTVLDKLKEKEFYPYSDLDREVLF